MRRARGTQVHGPGDHVAGDHEQLHGRVTGMSGS
jgi:hypothetical protein